MKNIVCVIFVFCLFFSQDIKCEEKAVLGKLNMGKVIMSIPGGNEFISKMTGRLRNYQDELKKMEETLHKEENKYLSLPANELPAIKERRKQELEKAGQAVIKFKQELPTLLAEDNIKILNPILTNLQAQFEAKGSVYELIPVSNDLNWYYISSHDYTSSIIDMLGGKMVEDQAVYNITDIRNVINDLDFYVVMDFCAITWGNYYNSEKKLSMSLKNEEEIKDVINREVEEWQKKGEFESTSMWQERVNDKTRSEYIESRKNHYIKQYNTEVEELRKEQNQLMAEFKVIMDKVYKQKHERSIAAKTKELKNSEFILRPYDADHETFLISNSIYGDILLSVPLSEASGFKSNWSTVKASVNPMFVPQGDEDVLTKLEFYYNGKSYNYDNNTVGTYALTEVNYNFKPIDFKGINVADVQIEPSQVVSMNTGQKIISNEEGIKSKTVEIQSKVINASTQSNIDYEIPNNPSKSNSSTFAVIIANENYDNVINVPFAINDGEILNVYLISSVGLPKDHVKMYKDASFGNMAAAMKHVENLSKAFGSDLNLIFYYAGHGFQNEGSKNPLLLPVDGDASIPETCYDLDKVVSGLGDLNANSVVMLLDACFSGTERGDGMLTAARGVKMRPKQTNPIGNMVIMSASQGDETAYPYTAEQHGLFTYFILKRLQEKNGDVTLGELYDFVAEHVKRQSVVSNGKLQTPSISVSPLLESTWRNIGFGQ